MKIALDKYGRIVDMDCYRTMRDFKCWDNYLSPRNFDYNSKEDYIRLYPLRGIAEFNMVFKTAEIAKVPEERLEVEIEIKKEMGKRLHYYTKKQYIMDVEARNIKNGVQTVSVHFCTGIQKNPIPESISLDYCKDIVEIMRQSLNDVVGPYEEHRRNKVRGTASKRIQQYTLDGKFIAEYDSLKLAAIAVAGRAEALCNISSAARGKIKSSLGFLWKYAEE